jgi:Tfp pilus assembly protein PilF
MQASKVFELGVGYLDHSEVEMALLAFNQAIRLDPNYAQAFNGRAVVHAMKDALPSALADCCEAIRLDPWNPEFYRTRGYVYSRLGDEEKGQADIAKADEFEHALEQTSQ